LVYDFVLGISETARRGGINFEVILSEAVRRGEFQTGDLNLKFTKHPGDIEDDDKFDDDVMVMKRRILKDSSVN